MTADGFVGDPAALRAAAHAKADPMIEAANRARARFVDASHVGSSFPVSMSSQQARLDEVLATLADAAGDGVRIVEDYRERLLHTADLYEQTEQANTDGLGGMGV